jgi:hypothetical protein
VLQYPENWTKHALRCIAFGHQLFTVRPSAPGALKHILQVTISEKSSAPATLSGLVNERTTLFLALYRTYATLQLIPPRACAESWLSAGVRVRREKGACSAAPLHFQTKNVISHKPKT